MNKIQEKIIDIIHPYMDKTLSEGCIIYGEYCLLYNYIPDYCVENGFMKILSYSGGGFNGVDYYGHTLEIYSEDNGYYNCGEIDSDILTNGLKVIGIYDITALLKYFKSKKIKIKITEDGNFINIYIKNSDKSEDMIYSISNKSLHLYGEEEQKLLNILLEIENNNK